MFIYCDISALIAWCGNIWSRWQDSNLHNLAPKASDQPLTHIEILTMDRQVRGVRIPL